MEGSSTLMADPASLRAAALSTLKSKRRKPVVEKPPPVPSRPPPIDTFPLDYGQEETRADIPVAGIPASMPHPPVTKERASSPHDSDIAREEGEISEEEPPPISKSPTPPTKRSKSLTPSKHLIPQPKSAVAETISTFLPTLHKSPTPETKSQTALVDRISDLAPSPIDILEDRPPISITQPFQLGPALDSRTVGPDCVRPGLHLTQDEYDTVKDIILDLLGWGVPPDYLIECGLSQAAIYYVFSELNLSLPETFNSSGIVPYTLESFYTSQQAALMPPPPAPDNRSSVVGGPYSLADRISRAVTPPPRSVTLPQESPSNADLHDIERQRRQELMARKAAQASRRVKRLTPSDPENAMLTSAVPTEAVDDFLKSLGSVVPIAESPAARQNGAMDEDRASPGSFDEAQIDPNRWVLSPNYSPNSPPWDEEGEARAPSPIYSLVSPWEKEDDAPLPASSIDAPISSAEPLPTSGSSMSTLSHVSDSEIVTPSTTRILAPVLIKRLPSEGNAPLLEDNSTTSTPVAGPRRGVKRPVAADFVDFDPTPRRNEVNMRNDRANSATETGITKRLSASTGFFNVGSSRMVIDLSDSEDDAADHPVNRQIHQPHLLQLPVADNHGRAKGGRSTKTSKYPSPAPVKPLSSGTNSPAALAQKEIEIRKMRELIARKEAETRLKKLAAMAKAKAANGAPPPPTATQPAPPKEEDVDIDMSSVASESPDVNGGAGKVPDPPYRRSSESATPPPVGEVSSLSIPVSRSASKSSSDLSVGDKHNDVFSENTEVPDQVFEALDSLQVKAATALLHQQLQLLPGLLPEGPVDVDMDPSSSAQPTSMTKLAHLKRDARKQELLDDLAQQHETANDDSDVQQRHESSSSRFSAYRSPFESHPLLRSRPLPIISLDDGSPLFSMSSDPHLYSLSPMSFSDSLSVTAKPSSSRFSRSLASFTPDLRLLRLSLMIKKLDPLKRLCQYEVPGGGVCRDASCEDVHLSRLEGTKGPGLVEPSDQEAAEYIFGVLPEAWLSKYGVDSSTRILQALQEVHQRTPNNSLDLEDRVAQALTLIGPSTT